MTRFNPPLTPAETTALQQACVELDAERLNRITFFSRMSMSCSRWARKENLHTGSNIESAAAYHLAAALLAGQMAERL